MDLEAEASTAGDDHDDNEALIRLGPIIFYEYLFKGNSDAVATINARRRAILGGKKKENIEIALQSLIDMSTNGDKFALILVDSQLKNNMPGHVFIEQARAGADGLGRVPFAIFYVHYAARVNAPPPAEPAMLVVDSPSVVCKGIRNMFKPYGNCKVYARSGSEEALGYLRGLRPHEVKNIRVLIIEIRQLGGAPNYPLLQTFKEILTEAVVVVTLPEGVVELGLTLDLINQGAIMVLGKPFNEELVPFVFALC